MTLIAGFGHGILDKQLGRRGTVRVVAIRASHFALQQGVARNLVAVSALLLVAGVANFRLGLLAQHFVGRLVHLVTRVTSHTAVLVLTTIPVVSLGALVTRQALA